MVMYFNFVEIQIEDNKYIRKALYTLYRIIWLLLAVTSVLDFVNRIENSINDKRERVRTLKTKDIGSMILLCMCDKEPYKYYCSEFRF